VKKLAGALLAATLVALTAPARAADVDAQAWAQIIAQGKIVGPLRWYAEAQLRLNEFDQGTQAQQLLLRPALGVALPKGFTLHAGYAWTPTFNPKFNDEQRPWQQVMHTASLGTITFANRLRFEERVIEGVSGVALRFRYMARAVWMPKHSIVGAVVWDELFLDLNSPAASIRGGFAQNRFAVGVQVRPIKQLWIEPTFLIQTIDRGGAGLTRFAPTGLLLVWINL
jgi:hypothetical protein